MQEFFFKEFKPHLTIDEIKLVISNLKNESGIKHYLIDKLKKIRREDNSDIDLLYDCENYFVILTNRNEDYQEKRMLTSYYNNVLITPISKNLILYYKRYCQELVNRIDILDKSKKLHESESSILNYNEFLEIKSFTDIIQLKNVSSGFLLEVHFKKYLDYVWEYDMDTLYPVGYSCVVRENYRLEHTLKLLEKIRNEQSIEPLNNLCKHSSHIIRWESIKLLINLDLEKGVCILNNMQFDDHPEIRIAAIKSIENLRNNGYDI